MPDEKISLEQRLENAEVACAEAKIKELNTKEIWLLEEARRRGQLRVDDELGGKKRSCKDIEADILVERNTPGNPICKAYLDYNNARASHMRESATRKTLSRANWKETHQW